MMRALIVASVVVLGACNYDPPEIEGPPVPDAAIVGRPWGIIDGACTGEPGKPRVMVYTRENMWRHQSNYDARLAIYNMCVSRGFNVITTNDPLAINAARLSEIDVVVFSITSGSDMDPLGKADLEAWVRAGGGLVGLHSASATESEWPFYVESIGAQFLGHVPGMQRATIRVEGTHPITDGLAPNHQWTEEWYFFQSRPEDVPDMQMLVTLDEDTLPADYPEQYKVGYHPIAWAHEKYGGRVFYTALGHNPDGFTDPWIVDLVGRAIEWAAHQR